MDRQEQEPEKRDDARSSIKMFLELYLKDFMDANPNPETHPNHINFLKRLKELNFPQNIYTHGK